MKNKKALFLPAFILLFLALAAVLAPYLPLQDPTSQELSAEFAAPSASHWLGQGENGVDVLSQTLWGARISLLIGICVVLFSSLLGLLLGSFSGYFQGWFDQLIMRIVDVFYAFPGILLVVTLAVFLGPSIKNLIIALCITSWISYARVCRAMTLSLKQREFVQASKASGSPSMRTVIRHVWPNLLPTMIVKMTYHLGSTILTESSLSFLGLGAPPGTPSWGQMLNAGREVMTTSPHLILVPATAIVLSVLSLNFFGDGLRDFLDPKFNQTG
jgi:ABC-type dipeptide/oligopeptide/nickel transport system permease subunit